MTESDEAFGSWASSKHFLAWSIKTKCNLLNQTNKLAAALFQTSLGSISCNKRNSKGFKNRHFWQVLRLLTISFVYLSKLGEYIVHMVFDYVHLISRWPVSRIYFIAFISMLGMTILLSLRIRLLTIVSSFSRL